MSQQLEETASNLLKKVAEHNEMKKELKKIEDSISAAKETEPIEREYAEVAELEFAPSLSEHEQERQKIMERLRAIEKERQQLKRSFFDEVKRLTLPLPANPVEKDASYIFEYRDNKRFPSIINALQESLGLKPVKIENVTFLEDSIKVETSNAQEAKHEVVSAIKTLRSLAEVYISPKLIDDTLSKLKSDRYRVIWETILRKGSATLDEISKETGLHYEEMVQACYDMTRNRLWKPYPPIKRTGRGVYELTIVGRILSGRYQESEAVSELSGGE